MKKIAIYLIFSVVTVTFAVLNLTVTSNNEKGIDLNLDKLEAVAGLGSPAEWGGWRNFSQGQGYWLNEWHVPRQCTTYSYISIRIEGAYEGTSGRKEVQTINIRPPSQGLDCAAGNINCTPAGC